MNYSVYFFDGIRWREFHLACPIGINIGEPDEVFFDLVKTILSFNKNSIVKPTLYERIYRRGYYSDPDYVAVFRYSNS